MPNASPSPSPRKSYIDGPSGQVHVRDSGGGGTPLLILHQSPTSSLDWLPTFDAFARAGQRIIAPDNPGLGLSDAPAAEIRMQDYVESALAVLDALGVERTHLLGHHTGASVAATLAADHPERVEKVVFYGAPFVEEATLQKLWTMIVPHEKEGRVHRPEPDGAHLIDYYERVARVGGPHMGQRNLHAVLTAGPRYWEAHNAALTFDMRPDLGRVQAPMLFVSHEGEMLHAASVAGHQSRPGSRLTVLPGVGSSALDHDPEGLAEAVIAFLREP